MDSYCTQKNKRRFLFIKNKKRFLWIFPYCGIFYRPTCIHQHHLGRCTPNRDIGGIIAGIDKIFFAELSN